MPRSSEVVKDETGIGLIEMRTAPRHPILQRCFVYLPRASASRPWQCIAYNISTTGVGITLPLPLPEGTLLTIEAWNLPNACPLQARIIQRKPVQHLWFTGCEFLRRLPDRDWLIWRNGSVDWLESLQS